MRGLDHGADRACIAQPPRLLDEKRDRLPGDAAAAVGRVGDHVEEAALAGIAVNDSEAEDCLGGGVTRDVGIVPGPGLSVAGRVEPSRGLGVEPEPGPR